MMRTERRSSWQNQRRGKFHQIALIELCRFDYWFITD